MVTAIAFTNALPPLRVKVPSLTAVVPLKVFAPLSVSSEDPAFTKLCAPLITPVQFAALATVSVVALNSDADPAKVNPPEF
jgi:hypothetical protein